MAPRLNGNRSLVIGAVLATMGVVFLVVAFLVENDWLSNVLIEIGGALVLFAPLLRISRNIENRIGHVEERQERTATNIATLTDEVEQTLAEFRTTRDQLSQAVISRLATAREVDRTLFEAVETQPSPETIDAALERASALNLIYVNGCRVPLVGTELFIWFNTLRFDDDSWRNNAEWYLSVQHWSGTEVARLDWDSDLSAEELLVKITDELIRSRNYPGDKIYDPGRIFVDLRQLLELAHSRAVGERKPARSLEPLVEVCFPQWAVTDVSIVSIDPNPERHKEIFFHKLSNSDWYSWASNLEWVDQDSFSRAFDHGKALYEARLLRSLPAYGLSDEPPF